MDLDEAFGKLSEFNIKDHCHVNTNEDGDRFVGIKADTDDAMVYFPIGYQLPDEDKAIRNDIRHLIQVLSEFTTGQQGSQCAKDHIHDGGTQQVCQEAAQHHAYDVLGTEHGQ